MDIIVVFRARSETMNFSMILKSYGVLCQIINTPRVINVSCGISVKLSYSNLSQVEEILQRRKFVSYAGVYRLESNGLNNRVVRLR